MRLRLILLACIFVACAGFLSSSEYGSLAAYNPTRGMTTPEECGSETGKIVWCDSQFHNLEPGKTADGYEKQAWWYPASVKKFVHPGVYLYQLENGTWKVDSYRDINNPIVPSATPSNPWANPWPAVATVFSGVDMTSSAYLPDEGLTVKGYPTVLKVPYKDFDNIRIYKVESNDYYNRTAGTVKSLEILDGQKLYFSIEIGGLNGNPHPYYVEENDKAHYGPYEKTWGPTKETGKKEDKYNIGYDTGMYIFWLGTYTENKRIALQGKTQMAPNTKQQLKATVENGLGTDPKWDGKLNDVSARAGETTWEVESGKDVLGVSSTGEVTAKSKGTAIVRVHWKKDGRWWLSTTITITVTDNPPDIPDIPPGGGQCTAPSKTSSILNPAANMNPNVHGVLRADNRDAEKFDVSKGIPTTEMLYANIFAKNYLNEYDFGKYDGECNWTINVSKTYNLQWEMYEQVGYSPCTPQKDGSCTGGGPIMGWVPYSDTQTVTKTYTVNRKYTFWALDKFNTYKIKVATSTNYALPGGSIALEPQGYNPPNIQATKLPDWSSHIVEPTPRTQITLQPQTLTNRGSKPSIPNEDWKGEAEKEVKQVKVKNDKVVVDGSKIMDDVMVETTAPTPKTMPAAVEIGRDVLYKPNQKIEATKLNGYNYPTTGTHLEIISRCKRWE